MPMIDSTIFLENILSDWLSLNGEWEFRLGDTPPILISVPCAWETYTADKITDGPAFFTRSFTLPDEWRDKRILLEADAISFDATVRINGHTAGRHRGMWSPFQVDLTPFVRPGENAIEIEVWKPGRRFPLRESLAGFLPDVCTTFGGIWQSISLRTLSKAAFQSLRIRTTGNGEVDIQGRFAIWGQARAPDVTVQITRLDSSGSVLLGLARGQVNLEGSSFTAHLEVAGISPWEGSAGSPLYLAEASLTDGGEELAHVHRPIAFRDIAVMDGRTTLNSKPLHLRGILDWGWDARDIYPNSSTVVGDNLAKAQSLGFNMVKFCLFVPDEHTFQIMDREGMLVWLEMPMWLPRVTPEFRELALREYRDIFRSVHHHPSIAIVGLGCELNAEADAGFLQELHALAREWFPNALICDNSGSAEAYGGVATSFSDFYDYHFYTDPHFFQPLVQHFSRAYRPDKPWIYGEFCDADTLRNFERLRPYAIGSLKRREDKPSQLTVDERHLYFKPYGKVFTAILGMPSGILKTRISREAMEPWWLHEKVALDQDDFLAMRDYKRLLNEAGVKDSAAELTRIARHQATAIRKFIVEQVRTNSATGGYVVTGWTDTPITTSGVVDDFGNLKFSSDEWRQFNAERVLTIDRERRRQWVGGDRPAHKDPFTWREGEPAEIHLILSNGGETIVHGQLRWQLTDKSGHQIAGGAQEIGGLPGGEVGELMTLNVRMPHLTKPRPMELVLSASITDMTPAHPQDTPIVSFVRHSAEAGGIRNIWRLWVTPRPRLPSTVAVTAPYLHRQALHKIDPEVKIVSLADRRGGTPILATELTDELLTLVRGGASAVLWQMQADARYTRSLPFWREAIHVFQPHAFWEHVPHAGYADMRFFSIAADFAIDGPVLSALLGKEAQCLPTWRRFDARKMTWAEYLVEVRFGRGRMFVSTLRFEGGLGQQPGTFDTNPTGAWMLAALLGMAA